MNLLEECVRRAVERENGDNGDGWATPASTRKWVGPVISDVLDILTADGRISPPVPPGPCWAESPLVWPGREHGPRCDLLAGHDGAHTADGGKCVWSNTAAADPGPASHEEGTA